MKIFSLLRILSKWSRGDDAPADWHRDPLSHPALEAMCLDQLADLPFDPRTVCRQ
ncbi:hypothetical protein CU102_01665 [Phyllobacterium brassicacearum]|uniref:Uncharacterized protein n=1 Tax=Phyllobacterium brassicacearum TaxID=314235 RepID=A0A2P7BWE1_9HYPH|nr:hypothetical protein [Phyllobacterium brassicacearum]PSH70781.1 hypothetical protein CU102_01665 [Phyllobacterium brassicacearum]TDQ35730.1 hypothetical protein DEV91_101213 [Phyllobacterium brassicacearum]